jgi:F-box-like
VTCWLGKVCLRLVIGSISKNRDVRVAQFPAPNLPLESKIPLDIYQEIFAWLKPNACPDHTDARVYHQTLTKLARVCKYFAYYATHEIWRRLVIHGNSDVVKPRMPWYSGILTQLEMLEAHVKECEIKYGVLLFYWISYCNRPHDFYY